MKLCDDHRMLHTVSMKIQLGQKLFNVTTKWQKLELYIQFTMVPKS